MADASRFPSLALPFAITGAAAGWLSASFVSNPLLHFAVSRPGTAVTAALVAALTGAVIRRLCVGKRYRYEFDDPDPGARPRTDHWLLHTLLVLVAGAAVGAPIGLVCRRFDPIEMSVLGGVACALVFVPVCLLVIAVARRAQRGRLGSLVAGSDRRAVWAILATTLAVTTLEALPDWPAFATEEGPFPLAVPVALLAAAVVTLAARRADRRALALAEATLGSGVSPREDLPAVAPDVTRIDLGLGDGLLGRARRGAAAYRDREQMVALVRGSPAPALGALRGAATRGTLRLAAVVAVAAMHGAAMSSRALTAFEEARCAPWDRVPCAVAAALLQERDPKRARALRAVALDQWEEAH